MRRKARAGGIEAADNSLTNSNANRMRSILASPLATRWARTSWTPRQATRQGSGAQGKASSNSTQSSGVLLSAIAVIELLTKKKLGGHLTKYPDDICRVTRPENRAALIWRISLR